jgi:predicted lysophospholipase L1 biosynthesis ABC-type transport system permease subunit
MIRLAWSRLRYRPVRGSVTALLAAVLGALATPSTLFLLACVLYLPAALVFGGVRNELRTLATLGWSWRHLAGAVLAEYAMIGVVAAIVAAPLAALGDTTAGAGPAAAVACAVTLAAGAVRAAAAVDQVPSAERSRPS